MVIINKLENIYNLYVNKMIKNSYKSMRKKVQEKDQLKKDK